MARRPRPPTRSRRPASANAAQAQQLVAQGLDRHRAGDPQAAAAFYERALAVDPRSFDALHLLGILAAQANDDSRAVALINRAIKVDPGIAAAYNNRGNALQKLGKLDAAVASFDRAIALQPDYVEAHYNRANALKEMRKPDAAVAGYERMLALRPDFPFARGSLLHAKMLGNDWHGLDDLYRAIRDDVANGRDAAEPFGWQAICVDEGLLRRAAEIYSERKYRYPTAQRPARTSGSGAKIRLGYLCGEFREQATSILMTGVWEQHDREKFEIVALDNGWDDGSALRRRIAAAFDEMIDISALSDRDDAALVARAGIDILINLNGFFGLSRPGVFALRPAPLQVNYLGFPGTLGVDHMDYLVADRIVIPPDSRQHYAEKIVWLPDCYQANDRGREIADRSFSRAELGLPEDGFVFCCFNNNYKITPATFDGWMRILTQVDGSVLWLLADNAAAVKNLRAEAKARGIDEARLVFAKRMAPAEHLARHAAADLFLDTLPYNAHTTASDALWTGLPVLTQRGTTFPGRVAASLLHAIGLPELVTDTPAEYEAMAVALAQDPARLAALKATLATNRLTTPLFDTAAFTRALEDAFSQMHARSCAGRPADHFAVGGDVTA